MSKLWATGGAGRKSALPACVAVIVQEPAPVRCTLAPDTVHFPVALKAAGRPEEARALTVKSRSPNVLSSSGANTIRCLRGPIRARLCARPAATSPTPDRPAGTAHWPELIA